MCACRSHRTLPGDADVELAAIITVIVIALAFDYTNGFHDAANAIATSVSTRALTPRAALGMAAVFNLVGAFLGTKVASTVGSDIIDPPEGMPGLLVVFAALVGAIIWNLLTWYFGMPSSSSHALIGGLVGAALAASETVKWAGVLDKVVIPMVLSPIVGFVLAALLMYGLLWAFRGANQHKAMRGFRRAQIVSAAAMALGHGLQDAQKTMGVIVLALVIGGYQSGFAVPWWVILLAAGALSAGTYAGGWRIMRTLGRRIIALDPPRGFAAEATAASVLYTTAFVFAAPISTTQTITSSILGVGATRRLSAVRWGVAGNILLAWVLTIPMAGLVAAAVYLTLNLILT
jgi:PiT family inorganic phosphate transporter